MLPGIISKKLRMKDELEVQILTDTALAVVGNNGANMMLLSGDMASAFDYEM